MKKLVFTKFRSIELLDKEEPSRRSPRELRGSTVVTLVSPGTEVTGGFAGTNFPHGPGYSCVFRVEDVGSEVTDIAPGALVFTSAPHQSLQLAKREEIVPLPDGIAPEKVLFARLAGVSMSTLNTTTANPPARVVVTGLGPVGNLAAQIFSICGYTVTGVDPSPSRREMAQAAGLRDVRASLASGVDDLVDHVALHLECSGHEQAVLDGIRVVRKRGEIVLVGTPWARRTDIHLHDALLPIFKRFITVRSGWEWEIPVHRTEFDHHSLIENYAAAIGWIGDGRLNVNGFSTIHSPADAQSVYEGLENQSLTSLAPVFDWRKLG
jgi:threonine dehydrogenase-like Zn-dependent dehydrogenase